MAAAVAQFYFRCRIEWRHILHKVSVYQHTEYRQDNSIHGRDITISVFQKQTSAILELFFRLWLWPHHRYPHEILHKIAKFHPYRITYCGNMTTYRFFKMAAAATKYYFRFRICWYHCFHKVRVYQQTKFHRHISIHGWDITTSVFEKKTSAILEFYFRFWSRPFRRNLHVILHQATECRPNRSNHCGNNNVISIFQDGGRGRSILLPVSYLLIALPSESRNLSENQISSTHLLLNMVSVIFAVLEVSFSALTTVVKLPRKFLTLIFAVLLPFFCCTMLCKRGVSRHSSVCPCVCHVQQIMNINMKTVKLEIFTQSASRPTRKCLQVCQISTS